MIRAWGIGCSVSASVTRPTMIRAGSSAAVTDFDPGVGVGIDRDLRPGEPRIIDAELDAEVPAGAADGEPALGVAERRPGPGRQVVAVERREGRPLEIRYPRGRPVHEDPRDDAAHGLDRHLDVADRPAIHVEQPPLDHLLGPERDVGGRPVGVGIELDPAGAVAGRDRDGADR